MINDYAEYETLQELLANEYSSYGIIQLWNTFSMNESYDDQVIYHMSEFEEVCGDSFKEIYPSLDEFNYNDKYFTVNDLGNINSYPSATYAIKKIVDYEMLENSIQNNISKYESEYKVVEWLEAHAE